MSILEIPLDSTDELQSFDVDLDGSTYVIDLVYNARVDQWFASIVFRRDTAVVPILTGAGVVADYPLLAGTQHPDRPKGELVFNATLDPSRYDLGGRARLLYFDAAELGRT